MESKNGGLKELQNYSKSVIFVLMLWLLKLLRNRVSASKVYETMNKVADMIICILVRSAGNQRCQGSFTPVAT